MLPRGSDHASPRLLYFFHVFANVPPSGQNRSVRQRPLARATLTVRSLAVARLSTMRAESNVGAVIPRWSGAFPALSGSHGEGPVGERVLFFFQHI